MRVFTHVAVKERVLSKAASTDGFSRSGAIKLKEAIEAYWRARGRDVIVYLREAPFNSVLRSTRFEVCSDMVDGMPRGATAKARMTR